MVVTTRTMGTGNESLKFNLRVQRMISHDLLRKNKREGIFERLTQMDLR